MRIGFGVFVREDEAGVIEQVAIAFGYGFQPGDQIGELFHMPAADIAHDALAFGSVGA